MTRDAGCAQRKLLILKSKSTGLVEEDGGDDGCSDLSVVLSTYLLFILRLNHAGTKIKKK